MEFQALKNVSLSRKSFKTLISPKCFTDAVWLPGCQIETGGPQITCLHSCPMTETEKERWLSKVSSLNNFPTQGEKEAQFTGIESEYPMRDDKLNFISV